MIYASYKVGDVSIRVESIENYKYKYIVIASGMKDSSFHNKEYLCEYLTQAIEKFAELIQN